MENASKALIIAGAILLSILIISLGILIFNQAKEVMDPNAMTELEVSQFNTKFTQYTGSNIRGAQVNSLLNQIIQNNVSNQTDTSKQVKVTVSATDWQGTKPSSKSVTKSSEAGRAQTGKTYDVDFETDSKTGLVNLITIKSAGSSSGSDEDK